MSRAVIAYLCAYLGVVVASAAVGLGIFALVIMALAYVIGHAHAAEASPYHHQCTPLADLASLTSAKGEALLLLTDGQFHFLQGVYTMAPPPGLPQGNKAAWVVQDDGSAQAFFIDGDQVCSWLSLPQELVDMTKELVDAPITTDGGPTL